MPKKATTKKTTKTAAKKTAKKKIAKKRSGPLDPLDPEFNYVDQVKESLAIIEKRSKNKSTHFMSYSQIQHSMIPLEDFLMQYAVNSYGIPHASVVDIMGAEGLGKTTLLLTNLGWAVKSGCPILYQSSESKELDPNRAMRCLSTDPKQAEFILDRMSVQRVHSVDHSWEAIKNWVKVTREIFTDKSKPLVIGVDSWSKLMSEAEAQGFYNYGKHATPGAKAKGTNQASNLGHSKFAAALCRELPWWLAENNVVLLMVHHQMDKIDMSGGGMASFLPANTMALYNKTHVGGRAMNQNAAMQWILAYKSLHKDKSNKPIGKTVRLRVDKNSYGPSNRIIDYNIVDECTKDTDTYLQPALDFSGGLANLFLENKWLQTKSDDKLFTSPVLGVTAATADEFSAAFHANSKAKNELGRHLKMSGYSNIVDDIMEEMESAPPPEDTEDTEGQESIIPDAPLEVGELPSESK
jgi:RecA/RadA recombinase